MKKDILNLLFAFIASYLSIAFILIEINCFKWNEDDRHIVIGFTLIAGIGIWLKNVLKDD